jgi:hypothetical protein
MSNRIQASIFTKKALIFVHVGGKFWSGHFCLKLTNHYNFLDFIKKRSVRISKSNFTARERFHIYVPKSEKIIFSFFARNIWIFLSILWNKEFLFFFLCTFSWNWVILMPVFTLVLDTWNCLKIRIPQETVPIPNFCIADLITFLRFHKS